MPIGERAGHGPAGCTIAFAGPLAVAGLTLARRQAPGVRLRLPPSWPGRALLAVHLARRVVVEEALWRAPLVRLRTRSVRLLAAGVSGAGFVAIHVDRDGLRTLPAHAALTAAWTTSVLLDRRVRWALASHLLYNYAAVVMAPADGHAR